MKSQHHFGNMNMKLFFHLPIMVQLPIALSLLVVKQSNPLDKPDPTFGFQLRTESIMK